MAQNNRLSTTDQMQDLLLESPGFPEFLLALATISASGLGRDGAVTCTITVERDGGPATFASSSEEGRRLDETQYAMGDGPCLTALRQQRLVWIPDLKGDERWSDYLDSALQVGVRSALAVPTVSLIMAQQRGGRSGALEILQLAAKSSNRRIHDIANDIVQGAGLPAARLNGA